MSNKFHYKHRRGKIELEKVIEAMDGITMINSVRRGVIGYFVEGKTIRQTNVNSSLLMPYLNQVNSNIVHCSSYVKRFLYTNEFSPRGK